MKIPAKSKFIENIEKTFLKMNVDLLGKALFIGNTKIMYEINF